MGDGGKELELRGHASFVIYMAWLNRRRSIHTPRKRQMEYLIYLPWACLGLGLGTVVGWCLGGGDFQGQVTLPP